MVTMTVVYPHTAGASFDQDYYVATHMPLALDVWNGAATSATVHFALAGLAGDPPYVAMSQIEFVSMEAFQEAMARPRSAEVQGDVPNFTTITPLVQLSRKAM